MGKETLAGIAVTLTFVSYLPYLWSVWKKRTRPHAFSWIIWGIMTGIGFAVQLAGGAGAGACSTASSATFCLLIAALAYLQGKFSATRSDWITFGAGLATIPLWYITSDPFWALLLLMGIEGIGYWLTLKKAYSYPDEEMAFSYAAYAISIIFSLCAMQAYNFITMAYPVFVFLGNVAIVLTILLRRRLVAKAVACLLAIACLGLTNANACSPDQYRIVAFTPALAHWQDAEGQETGEVQPTFNGRIASNCRGTGNLEIQIVGRDAQGRQVQQAITTVPNVGPGGAGFDYTALLPYDARVAGYEASIVRVQ